jgi:CelD/BcsL family acetyltransferase involved in cellulose biosynthesis
MKQAPLGHWRDSVTAAAEGCGPIADASEDLFSTLAWFQNLERHGLAAEDTVRVLRVGGPGEALLLPLLRRPRGGAAAYGPITTSLSNYYSSLYAPIGTEAGCTGAACAAAAAELRRVAHAAVLDLQPLSLEGAFLPAMEAALRREGYWVDRYFCFGNWYLQVGGRRFAEFYESHVPSRIRNTIRRGRKKLDDFGDWDLRIETGGGDLEAAISDFDVVYRKSWKVPEPFPEFVPNLIRTAAREGWLRLGVIRLAGEPIAAQLWLVRRGRALIYKLAYDEAHKRFSAGSVLTHEMMRRVIDDERVAEVDYLTGDDAYKADWMSHRRERMGLVAFDPRTLQGLASAARHFGARWWRQRKAAARAGAQPTASPAEDTPDDRVPAATGTSP